MTLVDSSNSCPTSCLRPPGVGGSKGSGEELPGCAAFRCGRLCMRAYKTPPGPALVCAVPHPRTSQRCAARQCSPFATPHAWLRLVNEVNELPHTMAWAGGSSC